MAITLVVKTAAGGDGLDVTTAGVDTTGADLIVLVLTSTSAGSGDPSDSKGNTWTALTAETVGGGERTVLYYCLAPTVGSGHTFTWLTSGNRPCIAAQAFAGAGAFDAENAGGNNFGSTVQPGSVTPSEDGCVIVQGISFNVNGTWAINGGYIYAGDGTDYIANNATQHGVAAAYLIQTTAAATNPTWTHSPGGSSMAAVGAVFKASGGGGGGRTTKNTRAWPLGVEVGMGHRMPC